MIGGALVGTGVLGKGGIWLYRLAKTGNAFAYSTSAVKNLYLYQGGFERNMSRKEALLILGIG